MGEYAHDAMRQEIRSRHGFDIGEYDDAPKKHREKIVYKRVKCPHCDAKPKEAGLWQHVRDVHGISQVERAPGKVPDNAGDKPPQVGLD
jgi:hypothetical protein